MARKYGMRSGYVEAINHVSGTVTVADGETTASVDFDEAMENPPAVVVTPAQDGANAYVPADGTETTGFTLELDAAAGENGEVFHYVAIDESRY